ncbi:amino acid kinase family protein [Methylopila sp. Yamaguchi]|uniref:amino acid kinase family protein n=1 Tax=Methylopila sp. Yamaguchi TaxID=1437817 RepID=UPI000CC04E46|nr:aspartate kinase [Methylopila sp. Yamaguchi]GBD50058.1 putative amino acid kinase [Methylopila sp. Yamaguchi]
MLERASAPSPIVKLGGSLLGAPTLRAALDACAAARAFVVPGGGPFADAVRRAQLELGFDDRAAHGMAILAMEQTALALASLCPALPLRREADEVAAAVRDGLGGLWAPARMALAAEVPASWDVTSDSLALWLALTLGAERLVLVKSAPAPAGAGPKGWAEAGLVDPFVPTLAAGFSGAIDCVEAADLAAALRPAQVAA